MFLTEIMMLDRILLPVDGSPAAESALPIVSRLVAASATPSELLPLTAVWPSVAPALPGIAADIVLQLEQAATTYINSLQTRLTTPNVSVAGLVRFGAPAEVILETIDERSPTLVAMATHGHSGLSRLFLGSVTEYVLRYSPVPLLVVRHTAPQASSWTPQHILLPIDGGTLSLSAAKHAAAIARMFPGARLEVIRIVPSPSDRGATHRASGMLESDLQSLEHLGVPIAGHLRHAPNAARGILEACEHSPCDLITMATHGRDGLARWMLGSVTEEVLRAATVPLLIV